jgi:pimeloyl-ACP methyl ester carboxylesterase
LQRRLHLDPDRIYVTGHSMGGHLSWRSAIYLGDRWGAVAPMSGGYDYVETQEVFPLVNIPGYATFGRQEPYNINKFNLKIRDWMTQHHYDWQLVEKPGGHEIYRDELPKVARFLLAHPRDLYRPRVFAAGGAKVAYDTPDKNDKWPQPHQWNPERPLPYATFGWIRLQPLPDGSLPPKAKQRLWAVNRGHNRIEITSQQVRRLRIYLHPRMVDFERPIAIVANGRSVWAQRVTPSLETMLELVREFDDPGRIFHAAVDVEIQTDADALPEPTGAGD